MLVHFHSFKRKIKDNAKLRKLLKTFGTPDEYEMDRYSIRVVYSSLRDDFKQCIKADGGRVKRDNFECRASIHNEVEKRQNKTPKPVYRERCDPYSDDDMYLWPNDGCPDNDDWEWDPVIGQWEDMSRFHCHEDPYDDRCEDPYSIHDDDYQYNDTFCEACQGTCGYHVDPEYW